MAERKRGSGSEGDIQPEVRPLPPMGHPNEPLNDLTVDGGVALTEEELALKQLYEQDDPIAKMLSMQSIVGVGISLVKSLFGELPEPASSFIQSDSPHIPQANLVKPPETYKPAPEPKKDEGFYPSSPSSGPGTIARDSGVTLIPPNLKPEPIDIVAVNAPASTPEETYFGPMRPQMELSRHEESDIPIFPPVAQDDVGVEVVGAEGVEDEMAEVEGPDVADVEAEEVELADAPRAAKEPQAEVRRSRKHKRSGPIIPRNFAVTNFDVVPHIPSDDDEFVGDDKGSSWPPIASPENKAFQSRSPFASGTRKVAESRFPTVAAGASEAAETYADDVGVGGNSESRLTDHLVRAAERLEDAAEALAEAADKMSSAPLPQSSPGSSSGQSHSQGGSQISGELLQAALSRVLRR